MPLGALQNLNKIFSQNGKKMKTFSLICASLLFIALTDFPIGYYTFLRIVITIGAVIIIKNEFEIGLNFWVITFGIIAVFFNPIIPIYLHNKNIWAPIDIISGILFVIKAFKKGG